MLFQFDRSIFAIVAGHSSLIHARYRDLFWLAILRIVFVFPLKLDHHAGARWNFHFGTSLYCFIVSHSKSLHTFQYSISFPVSLHCPISPDR
jgi:hypothetical protein